MYLNSVYRSLKLQFCNDDKKHAGKPIPKWPTIRTLQWLSLSMDFPIYKLTNKLLKIIKESQDLLYIVQFSQTLVLFVFEFLKTCKKNDENLWKKSIKESKDICRSISAGPQPEPSINSSYFRSTTETQISLKCWCKTTLNPLNFQF